MTRLTRFTIASRVFRAISSNKKKVWITIGGLQERSRALAIAQPEALPWPRLGHHIWCTCCIRNWNLHTQNSGTPLWSTITHRLLRETGQISRWETGQISSMPLYFYRFRCVARFWDSLLTTNNALLSKTNESDLLLAHKQGCWTFKCQKFWGLICSLQYTWSWCAHIC